MRHQNALAGIVAGAVWVLACASKVPPTPTSAHDSDGDSGVGIQTDGAASPDGASVDASGNGVDGGVVDSATTESSVADARGPIDQSDSCTCLHGTCNHAAGTGCYCDADWGGPTCDQSSPALSPEVPVAGTVTRGQTAYYHFVGLASGLRVTITEDASVGLVWGYLATNGADNLAVDEDVQHSTHVLTHAFQAPGMQTWTVAVYGQPAIPTATQLVTFSVQLTVIP